MPFNDFGFSFNPLGGVFNPPPRGLNTYVGMTTAQLTAAGYTGVVLALATSTLVDAAKKRTTGITLVVPTDQVPVAVGNTALVGPFPNWQAPTETFGTSTNTTGLSSGFIISSGNALRLVPFNDPVYGYASDGSASEVFFLND